jgi:malonyl-CoA O-methyltransferase
MAVMIMANFSVIKMNVVDANQYWASAVIAQEAAAQMIQRLDGITLKPLRILEIGAGRGLGCELLRARYPQAVHLSIDSEPALLHVGKERCPANHWMQADARQLPFASHSIDFIFANLVLPWFDDLNSLLQEWRRVLTVNGLLMISSLGPDTLKPCYDLMGNSLLPSLVDMHEVGDQFIAAKFADPVMDVDYVTLAYKDIQQLVDELQLTGMLIPDQYQPLYTEMHQTLLSNEKLLTTYELVFGHAWGPDLSVDHTADSSGVVKFPLAHLRGRKS